MSLQAVLAPVLVQVLLTFALLIWTGRARFSAARAGSVRIADIAMGERNWPAPAQRVANAFDNQFQLPVLFYALTAFALLTRKADLAFVAMAWIFVLSRIAHALAYATTNPLMLRFRLFLGGALVLMAMWIVFGVRILLAPGA